MNWISVKNDVPPAHEGDPGYSITVLITDGKNIATGYYEYEYIADDPDDPHQYSSDVWHDDSNLLKTNCCGWAEVTHWAPLPEPPTD